MVTINHAMVSNHNTPIKMADVIFQAFIASRAIVFAGGCLILIPPLFLSCPSYRIIAIKKSPLVGAFFCLYTKLVLASAAFLEITFTVSSALMTTALASLSVRSFVVWSTVVFSSATFYTNWCYR